MDREGFTDLASAPAVHDAIDDLDLGGGIETVALEDAHGRVLAERIDAEIDVPGFDRASMDGYAVRAADTEGAGNEEGTGSDCELDLVGRIRAGSEPGVTIEAGEAAEITTGAALPEGADAVVIVERTEEGEGVIEIRDEVRPGENVAAAGADIAAGSRALGPDTRLTPREIGLLSALGVAEVPVRARPRVGVVPTGDELVAPGAEINHTAGQIYDVNSHTLAAGIEAAGGEATVYPRVADDRGAIEETLRAASEECDLVLTAGASSVGATDVIPEIVEETGERFLHGIAVKPGKPTSVGRLGDAGYVGLPGYPVSALTVFRTFVAPAIREAAGMPEPATETVEGELGATERYDGPRFRYVAVTLIENGSGGTLVYPVDKGSGATTTLANADGVVEMEPETDVLEAGEHVTVNLFSPDTRLPGLLSVGEDDPLLSRLLDRVGEARHLPAGSREGLRRLREGVPDVAVVSGPETGIEENLDCERIGGWAREWGVVVPGGNPEGIDGIADLVDEDVRFVNRPTDSGVRASLGEAVAAFAERRNVERRAVVESISGFEHTAPGVESPARRVVDGRADAGIGLRETADRLGLGFVPLGEERVRVLANPDRLAKDGVRSLGDALDSVSELLDGLSGYEP